MINIHVRSGAECYTAEGILSHFTGSHWIQKQETIQLNLSKKAKLEYLKHIDKKNHDLKTYLTSSLRPPSLASPPTGSDPMTSSIMMSSPGSREWPLNRIGPKGTGLCH